MSYIAAGVGVAGLATSVAGGIMGAGAASKAAKEQAQAAQDYKNYVSGQETKATSLTLNPAAIAAHSDAIKAQSANVARQQQLVSQLDPNIVEAGKQTAALLQGKSAPVLANIQNQRAVQRQQFMDNLRTQLGPGAETSSAGIQAMQKFDLQTSDLMNQAQQSYLDKVSGMSMGGAKTLGESLSQVSNTLNTMNQDSPEATAAKLIEGFTGQGAGAQSAIVNAAGGEQKGKQLLGQSIGTIGSGLMQGAAFAAAGQLKGGSTTPPDTSGTPADANQMSMGTGNATPQQVASYQAAQIPGASQAPAPVGSAPTLGQQVSSPGVGIPAPTKPQGYGWSAQSQQYLSPDSMFNNGGKQPYQNFSYSGE